MSKTIIIGFGTGRCGSTTLANLLNIQDDAQVFHESLPLLPWIPDYNILNYKFNNMLDNDVGYIGDVGMYYLPYIEYIIDTYNNVKFIYIEREIQPTVRSFMKKTRNKNHWNYHDGKKYDIDPLWDPCFPKFETKYKKDALKQYVKEYHLESNKLLNTYSGKIYKLNTHELSVKDKLVDMLTFCGFPIDSLNIEYLHLNPTKPATSFQEKFYSRIRKTIGNYFVKN